LRRRGIQEDGPLAIAFAAHIRFTWLSTAENLAISSGPLATVA
jgi:hypothetical protein